MPLLEIQAAKTFDGYVVSQVGVELNEL